MMCPMPKLDFDIITMGHGSGGLLTNKLLDSGVFDLLKNDLLDERHDGAVFAVESGKMAFSTDSYVISPVFFPGKWRFQPIVMSFLRCFFRGAISANWPSTAP